MNQAPSPALEQALAALRAPGLLARLRERTLPEGIMLLLRVAAGDAQARNLACSIADEPEDRIVEAAELFIQQVMFHPGSDSYRVLGVSPGADESQIKEHFRWLVRWVHPDRRADDWNNAYADRVTIAWQDLRTVERRAAYKNRGISAQYPVRRGPDVSPAAKGASFGLAPAADGFQLSAQTVRRLPVLILCALIAGSIALLGLQAYVNRFEEPNAAAATPALIAARAPDPPVARPVELPAMELPKAATKKKKPSAVALPTVAQVQPRQEPLAVQKPSPAREPRTEMASPSPAPTQEILVSQAPTAAQNEIPGPGFPVLIDEGVARNLILQFRSAYVSGNIHQVRALLASEPLARKKDRKRILKSYGELFEESDSRWIELSNASWLTEGDTAILFASFDAFIVPKGEEQGHWVSGDIRFDLRQENGELRIVQLRHETKRG